jgi:hypothetical protein
LIYPVHLDAEDKVSAQEDGSYRYDLHMVLVVCTFGYSKDYFVFGLVDIDMQHVAGHTVVAVVAAAVVAAVVVVVFAAAVVVVFAVVAAGYTVVHFVVVLKVAVPLDFVVAVLQELVEQQELLPEAEHRFPLLLAEKHFPHLQTC